jgi:hypothetical protein
MDKSKNKKKQVQPSGKLSFGSALKQNVNLILFNVHFLIFSSKIQPRQAKNLRKEKHQNQ